MKRRGYSEVTTVVDGQQAMDELHCRGGADAFDIILANLHMPNKVGCVIHCLTGVSCMFNTHVQRKLWHMSFWMLEGTCTGRI